MTKIKVGDRVVSGQAEALDDNGALLLRTEHGHLERIIGGDVSLDRDRSPGAVASTISDA